MSLHFLYSMACVSSVQSIMSRVPLEARENNLHVPNGDFSAGWSVEASEAYPTTHKQQKKISACVRAR